MPDTSVLPKISCVSFSCPCRVKFTWWICTNYGCLSLQLLNLLIVFTVLISFLFHYLVWPRSLHFTHFDLQITAAKKQTHTVSCAFSTLFPRASKNALSSELSPPWSHLQHCLHSASTIIFGFSFYYSPHNTVAAFFHLLSGSTEDAREEVHSPGWQQIFSR